MSLFVLLFSLFLSLFWDVAAMKAMESVIPNKPTVFLESHQIPQYVVDYFWVIVKNWNIWTKNGESATILKVIIGNKIGYGAIKKISSKKHLMMVLVQIWDHFIIVIGKKYMLLSGLRFWFQRPKVPFLAYIGFH